MQSPRTRIERLLGDAERNAVQGALRGDRDDLGGFSYPRRTDSGMVVDLTEEIDPEALIKSVKDTRYYANHHSHRLGIVSIYAQEPFEELGRVAATDEYLLGDDPLGADRWRVDVLSAYLTAKEG